MGRQDILRIAIVGPECTGKSDLAQFLSHQFQTQWVPEFAREYIEKLNRPYKQEDLLAIAIGQLSLEDNLALKSNQLLICDTNLVVIKIWSEFKYNNCDPRILELMNNRKYDLHLLTHVDIPWEEDPQREHPEKRQLLFDLYKAELQNQNIQFVEIKGEKDERRRIAVQEIEKLLLK
jgi:NadR type nicotinamide-nucleotide adenylyltransferase